MKTSKESFQLVDVREEDEVKKGRIANSIWVPLGELTKRAGELDKRKETAVHCQSGQRSYKACLKLQHEGFENVKNVDGGMLCWCYDMVSTSDVPSKREE
jgi:rhodanese-related sulfurtransferase